MKAWLLAVMALSAAPAMAWQFPPLTWTPASMEGVVAFEIIRRSESCTIEPPSAPWEPLATLAKTERSYVDTTARQEQGYCYRISAIYPADVSPRLRTIVHIER